jgi:hypothetical protein
VFVQLASETGQKPIRRDQTGEKKPTSMNLSDL